MSLGGVCVLQEVICLGPPPLENALTIGRKDLNLATTSAGPAPKPAAPPALHRPLTSTAHPRIRIYIPHLCRTLSWHLGDALLTVASGAGDKVHRKHLQVAWRVEWFDWGLQNLGQNPAWWPPLTPWAGWSNHFQ